MLPKINRKALSEIDDRLVLWLLIRAMTNHIIKEALYPYQDRPVIVIKVGARRETDKFPGFTRVHARR